VDKKAFIFCIILVAMGAVFAGITGHIRNAYTGELESARSLIEQYRSAERLAGERITALESDNRRLQKHLGDAGRITEQLAKSVGANVGDSRAAIGLIKEIALQIQSLGHILDSSGSNSGGPGDMGGIPPETVNTP
jgi:hypothetical protein